MTDVKHVKSKRNKFSGFVARNWCEDLGLTRNSGITDCSVTLLISLFKHYISFSRWFCQDCKVYKHFMSIWEISCHFDERLSSNVNCVTRSHANSIAFNCSINCASKNLVRGFGTNVESLSDFLVERIHSHLKPVHQICWKQITW